MVDIVSKTPLFAEMLLEIGITGDPELNKYAPQPLVLLMKQASVNTACQTCHA